MGCCRSLTRKTRQDRDLTSKVGSDQKKQQILSMIQNNQSLPMATVIISEKIEPQLWTLIYMCCRWDSVDCLQYLLKDYFQKNPQKYIHFINTQTAEGYSCLHICAMWNSQRCFELLLNYGGIIIIKKDKNCQAPIETAKQYRSKKIHMYLSHLKKMKIEFIPMNIDKLSQQVNLQTAFHKGKLSENYSFEIKNIHGFPINFMEGQKEIKGEKAKLKKEQEKIALERKIITKAKKEKKSENGEKNQKQNERISMKLMQPIVEIVIVEQIQKQNHRNQSDEQTKQIMLKLQQYAKKKKALDEYCKDSYDRSFDALKQREKKKQSPRIEKAKERSKQIDETKKKFFQQYGKQIMKKYGQRSSISPQKNKASRAEGNLNYLLPKDIKQKYEKGKKSGKFSDEDFPSQNRSIGESSNRNYSHLTSNLIWLRPQEFLKGKFELFDGIDPNDIKQGSLGVCYMLSTISSLASHPQNIKKLFVFYDLKVGFYVLRLHINGKPQLIVVDDKIPCNKMSKAPLFTQPIGKQVWVLLLEKAWAKVIGNYLSAEAMTPDHMMEDFSGAPGYGSWLEDDAHSSVYDKVEEFIEHDRKGHVVVLTSGSKHIEGISNNHAYSLLKTFNYQGEHIFKIRNPWGHFQWSGKYGDTSPLLTSELKNLTNITDDDDGIFLLTEHQILEAFTYYSISQINPKSIYSFLEFQSKPKQDMFFTFNIHKSCECNLRITQPFQRMVKDKNYSHSPMILEIGKVQPDGRVTFLSEGSERTYWGAKSVHVFPEITRHLDSGTYFVRVRMLWKHYPKYHTAVIAVYCEENIKINQISEEEGRKLWKKLLLSNCLNLTMKKMKNIQYSMKVMKGQFVFPLYSVGTPARVVFSFNPDNFKNVEMGLGAINDHQIQLTVDADGEDVGVIDRTNPPKGGSTGQFKINIV